MARSKLPSVVIDTPLLSRLAGLEIAEFLPFLFSRVLIPFEVRNEAFRSADRKRLRNLLNRNSPFFGLCVERDVLVNEFLKTILDEGEAAAIAQAEHTRSVLILDENKGRREARRREIKVFPTGKILCLLKEQGLIPEVKPFLIRLRQMKFHLKEADFQMILAEAREFD